MWYLFLQIWFWVIGAFALGWLSHWFICCRHQDDKEADSNMSGNLGAAESSPATVATAPSTIDESWKPQGFVTTPDQVDDLKRIKGIGLVIEETLNDLGIYQFAQIRAWSNDNISWIENFLTFPGRIARENWVAQAHELESGGTTAFADRVDKGDIDYN